MRRTVQRFASLLIVGLGLSTVACSNHYVKEVSHPETGATLEGTVTYGGQKVTVAMIIAAAENSSARAFIGDDGRYKLENVPLGQVRLRPAVVTAQFADAVVHARWLRQTRKQRAMP